MKCVFPVAGFGTRFLPVTKTIPKEMLPILTKPLIEYGVDEAIEAGCSEFIFITNKYKKALEDYFDTNLELEHLVEKKGIKLRDFSDIKTIFIKQLKPKGLGDAINRANFIKENFCVILPDDLCYNEKDSVLAQMTKLSNKYKDCIIVAVEEVDKNEVNQYGIIEGDLIEENLYQVTNMVEKPSVEEAKSNLAIIGRYILIPEIFEIIDNLPLTKGEIQITDAINYFTKKKKVLAYKFQGKRFDCGRINGYLEANNFFKDLNEV